MKLNVGAQKISAAYNQCFSCLKTNHLFQVIWFILVTLLNFDCLQFFTPRRIHFNWLRKIVMQCPRASFANVETSIFELCTVGEYCRIELLQLKFII